MVVSDEVVNSSDAVVDWVDVSNTVVDVVDVSDTVDGSMDVSDAVVDVVVVAVLVAVLVVVLVAETVGAEPVDFGLALVTLAEIGAVAAIDDNIADASERAAEAIDRIDESESPAA